jgi:hypothetical protein
MNYGERLKKIKIDLENKNTARQRREAEMKRAEIEKEMKLLRDYFDSAWREAVAAIEDELIPKGIVVKGYGMPFRYKDVDPSVHSHPYHDIYREYVALGEHNGLDLKIIYEHDGVGMESWHRIIFTV